ncbi:hypothetical protein [Desulfotomaculum sp. 1211_IL3151]|uniref:hypothetical protein n=1 Tax=Desulfotomaculum sp. 1211_IL3151 TaxID=3084055 RepID=UPI002FDB1E15
MLKRDIINKKIVAHAALFGFINTIGVSSLHFSHKSLLFLAIGMLLVLFNAWFYMLYCYKHGSYLKDKEKYILGSLFVGILALSNIISGNKLFAAQVAVDMTPTNVLMQLILGPIISCMVTVLLCKQDFLIKDK